MAGAARYLDPAIVARLGTIDLKARALLNNRYHVAVADIQALARPVLRHRIIPNFYAESERITSDHLVERLLEAVPVPRSGM